MGTGVLSGSRGHFLSAGWGGPAKDGSFIFSRFLLLSRQPEVKAIRRKPDIDANHVLFTFYMIA